MQRTKWGLVALTLWATSAGAQQFTPVIDKDLWDILVLSLADVQASAKAHNQIQNILREVQQEALRREQGRKAQPKVDPNAK